MVVIEFFDPALLPQSTKIESSDEESSCCSPPPRENKRKAAIAATRRAAQKRFYVSNRDGQGDHFLTKNSDNVPMTTNKPRQVGVYNASGELIRSFPSCSAAARRMDISRSKISRVCRQGGGHIDGLLYLYVEDGSAPKRPVARKDEKAAKKESPPRKLQCTGPLPEYFCLDEILL